MAASHPLTNGPLRIRHSAKKNSSRLAVHERPDRVAPWEGPRWQLSWVGADVLFFRGHFWERLAANVGIVLVFVAFYFRLLHHLQG